MRNFEDLRLRAGLSIDEVGSLLGVSPQTVEAYERGDRKPTVREVQALSGLASIVPRARKLRAEQLAIADLFPAADVRRSKQQKQDIPAGSVSLSVVPGERAIEDEAFPFEAISAIAERESWRKEINRPLSHIHKWWAQRLGSVFRAIVIGAAAPKGADVLDLFYRRVRLSDAIVYDPFMGSGTTIVETVKLGGCAIGRDLNPVAHFLVKNAVNLHERDRVIDTFHQIERDVAGTLSRFYQACLPDGRRVPVLYYFWVMTVPCPACDATAYLCR
jgi:transcriptional regulator with XRE-family HTH domain